jgi:nucleoside-diphosphate-sugar epimerase
VRVLLTGGSGAVGAFVAPALTAAGHHVLRLDRRPKGPEALPFDLARPPAQLPPADALVHLALAHLPGRFRGGEGGDPATFLALNRDGSRALIRAARAAGVRRVLLLSSRAVYGDARRGQTLRETDPLAPDSLYGRVKAELEPEADVAIRATGVYGLAPGAASHKWSGLFADFLAGRPIAARAATEVHGADLAAAIVRLLAAPRARGSFNASDLLLDRADLLAAVAARAACPYPPPPHAPGPPPGVMATDRLRRLGWRPGGPARLAAFLDAAFPATSAAG